MEPPARTRRTMFGSTRPRSRAVRSPARLCGMAACGALLASVAACGGSDSGDARSVTVAIPPAVSGIDVYAAQEQGFFRKHHLEVDVRVLNGGSAIVPALEAGSVQIGESNVLSVIQGAARGVQEPCFSGSNTDPRSGHYLSLVAAPGAGPALRGKTVAVNATSGINELLTDAYLTKHGIPPSAVHTIGMQFPDMPASLSGGRVAAAMTTEPFTSLALARGAKLLEGTPLDAVPGRPTYSCWNAERSWLTKNRPVAADFAAAMHETDAYIAAHPGAFRKLAGEHLKIAPKVQASMTLPVFTDALAPADITAWQTAAKKYGLLTRVPPQADVLQEVGQ